MVLFLYVQDKFFAKLPHLPLDLFFMDTLRSSSRSEHDELLLLVLDVGDCAEKKTNANILIFLSLRRVRNTYRSIIKVVTLGFLEVMHSVY